MVFFLELACTLLLFGVVYILVAHWASK